MSDVFNYGFGGGGEHEQFLQELLRRAAEESGGQTPVESGGENFDPFSIVPAPPTPSPPVPASLQATEQVAPSTYGGKPSLPVPAALPEYDSSYGWPEELTTGENARFRPEQRNVHDPVELLEGRQEELIGEYVNRVPDAASVPGIDMGAIEELRGKHEQLLQQSERILGGAGRKMIDEAANFNDPYFKANMRAAGVSDRELMEVRDRVSENQQAVDNDVEVILKDLESFGTDVRHAAIQQAIRDAQVQFQREAAMVELRDAAKAEQDRQTLTLDAWDNEQREQEQRLKLAQGVAMTGDTLTLSEISGLGG